MGKTLASHVEREMQELQLDLWLFWMSTIGWIFTPRYCSKNGLSYTCSYNAETGVWKVAIGDNPPSIHKNIADAHSTARYIQSKKTK